MTAQRVRITLFRRLSGLYRLQAETRKRFRDRRDLDRLSLPPGVSDDESYRKIKEMIPELNSYKASTVRHLREKAAAAGCRDLEEYRLFLLEHAEELEKLKSNLTRNGTDFFRGNDWDYFNRACLAKFAGRKDIRVWCAGCSTGEEVFSLLLLLIDYVPLEGIRVLATDYSDEMLEKCRQAAYSAWNLNCIPEKHLKYVRLCRLSGPLSVKKLLKPKFTFVPEMKDVITTQNLNLLTDPYPEGFDIILCRNVLKFFSLETIGRLQEKLVRSLAEGGFLFLSTDGNSKNVELIRDPEALGVEQMDGRCIYRKKAAETDSRPDREGAGPKEA